MYRHDLRSTYSLPIHPEMDHVGPLPGEHARAYEMTYPQSSRPTLRERPVSQVNFSRSRWGRSRSPSTPHSYRSMSPIVGQAELGYSSPSPPSSPPFRSRSVKQMKQPFHLLLSDPPLTSRSSQLRPARRFPIRKDSLGMLQPKPETPITSPDIPQVPQIDQAALSERAGPRRGSHDSEKTLCGSESHQHQQKVVEEMECACSPPGSPCEELCIFSDYEQGPRHVVVKPMAPPAPGVDEIKVENETPSDVVEKVEGVDLSAEASAVPEAKAEKIKPALSLLGKTGLTEVVLPRSPRANRFERSIVLPVRRTPVSSTISTPNGKSWLDDASTDSDVLSMPRTPPDEDLTATDYLSHGKPQEEKDDDQLERAVSLSMVKPKLIDVPRRLSSSASSRGTQSPETSPVHRTRTPDKTQFDWSSMDTPLTPPESPTATKPALQASENRAEIPGTQEWFESEPSDDFSNQRNQAFTPPDSPSSIRSPMLSKDDIASFATTLEAALSGFPSTMLQPDSPIIRLVQAQASLSDGVNARHRTVSLDQPASNSPNFSRPIRHSSSVASSKRRLDASDDPPICLTHLRRIFPATSDFLRASLSAHVLVSNHVEDLITYLLSNAVDPAEEAILEDAPTDLISAVRAASARYQDKLVRRLEAVARGLRDCEERLMVAMCGHVDRTLLTAVNEIVRIVGLPGPPMGVV